MKSLALSIVVVASLLSIVVGPTAMAADCGSGKILTLKPWYDGLTMGDKCTPQIGSTPEEHKKFVWTVGLNIVEDLMHIAVYLTVGLLIYGGFVYMTSMGKPDKITAGQKIIINSLAGMVVAISSVLIVNLVIRNALGVG